MIESSSNPKLKLIKKLHNRRRTRQKEQLFVIETTRWIKEVVQRQIEPAFTLYTSEWATQNQLLWEKISGPKLLIDHSLLQSVSDTENSPGILAVIPMPHPTLPIAPSFVLLLDGIASPGNLGTILRTAAAANLPAVILAPNCVDLYNPKVVRATMGGLLSLPIASLTWPEIAQYTEHTTKWAASASTTATSYKKIDWQKEAITLIIGSEAIGLSADAITLSPQELTIPMPGETESLNAAVAAGILIFSAI